MRPNHPRNAERKARKNRKKILTVPALVEGGRGRRNRPVFGGDSTEAFAEFRQGTGHRELNCFHQERN
jgi:hypothetical protein